MNVRTIHSAAVVAVFATVFSASPVFAVGDTPSIVPNTGGTHMQVDGDKQLIAGNCDHKDLNVSGDRLRATYHGHCGVVTLIGNRSVLVVDKVDEIDVIGDNNTIFWTSKPGYVSNVGTNNTVEKQPDPQPGAAAQTKPAK